MYIYRLIAAIKIHWRTIKLKKHLKLNKLIIDSYHYNSNGFHFANIIVYCSPLFGLGIAPKEIFLAYSTQFVFLTIRFVPRNVVMVVIDVCGKRSIKGA